LVTDFFDFTGAFMSAIVQGFEMSAPRQPSSSSVATCVLLGKKFRSSSSMPYILDLQRGFTVGIAMSEKTGSSVGLSGRTGCEKLATEDASSTLGK
jgi:hypothetical protein